MEDVDRLARRLEMLGTYRHELARLGALSADVYLDTKVYAGRYLVQVAVQTCIDIALYLISSEGWRSPQDLGDVFTVLHEHAVIDDVLTGQLRDLAALRTQLVHGDEIDDAHLHLLASAGLPDAGTFAAAVAHWMRSGR